MMATIKRNIEIWDSNELWEKGREGVGVGLDNGELWSKAWGTSQAQWRVTLLPRIEKYINVESILELGPGRGRWTDFLKSLCEELTIVDLSRNCIEFCKTRFMESDNIKYMVNDGKSLEGIPDNSIDFVFSFDSMVHVDASDLQSYVSELSRVLKSDGKGVLHHSNLGEYGGSIKSNMHLRAKDVSGELFRGFCLDHGMHIIRQEYIPWTIDNTEEGVYLDCISTFTKQENLAASDPVIKNPAFLQEHKKAKALGSSS